MAKELGSVGETIEAKNASWSFGGDTAKSFSNHVRRSVPFYDTGHDLACKISDFFIQNQSVCYELGSSTGVLTGKLAARHSHKNARFVGLEKEKEMVVQAGKEVTGLENVVFEQADILTYDYEPADMIVSYYTIQFVPPRVRQDLIQKIYDSLNWGGCFLLFEKVRACDARFQDMCTALYTDYKLDQGYNPEEIVAKSRSLKGVLEPFSTQGNTDLLKRAGFKDIMPIMKYVSFEGLVAIK